MSHAPLRRSLSWLRLALLGATWLAGLVLPRRDVIVVQGIAAQATARAGDTPARGPTAGPAIGWRAAAARALPSHYYSFRAAARRLGPRPTSDRCADRELLIANGYDHTPQHLARIAFRAAGDACVPAAHPYAWSPRALHYSDVAIADFDRDGEDEIVVTAFAEVGGRMHTGGVYVIGGADPWRSDPPALALDDDDGHAPSSVAIGDLDADGRLDLVVGTFWRGPRGAGRDVKHVRGAELDGPTLLFRGGDPRALDFARATSLAPRGVIDVHLADVDRDGALDIVTAGRVVTILFGPDLSEARELPLGDEPGVAVAPSIDVAWSARHDAALIAFTASCLSAEECARAEGARGVALWIVGPDREVRRVASWATAEVPAPLRFAALGAGDEREVSDLPDLVVGVMNEPISDGASAIVGRPWLGPLGLVGGSPLVLSAGSLDAALSVMADPDEAPADDAFERLALRAPAPTQPMASAIVPWADPSDARPVVQHLARARPVLTYTGPGEVVGAEVRTLEGAPVPVHHVAGDAHVSLAIPVDDALARGGLVVTWRVVERPHLIITSACPVAGSAAGTLFVRPPERARRSRALPSPSE